MPKGIKGFQKGIKCSKESIIKRVESRKGYKHSEETKKKMREKHLGKNNPMYGKKQPKEVIKKRMESRKGYVHSEETRDKMSSSAQGKTKSKEHKRKLSESQRGEKSHRWKGGITTLYNQIRKSYKYRQWRSDVFERDNYTCQECWIRSGCGRTVVLEAHHKKEFAKIIFENNINSFEQADQCVELWNINNGQTLCVDCHNLTRKGRKKEK